MRSAVSLRRRSRIFSHGFPPTEKPWQNLGLLHGVVESVMCVPIRGGGRAESFDLPASEMGTPALTAMLS